MGHMARAASSNRPRRQSTLGLISCTPTFGLRDVCGRGTSMRTSWSFHQCCCSSSVLCVWRTGASSPRQSEASSASLVESSNAVTQAWPVRDDGWRGCGVDSRSTVLPSRLGVAEDLRCVLSPSGCGSNGMRGLCKGVNAEPNGVSTPARSAILRSASSVDGGQPAMFGAFVPQPF